MEEGVTFPTWLVVFSQSQYTVPVGQPEQTVLVGRRDFLENKAFERGGAIMYSIWKIMCFLNIKACQHIVTPNAQKYDHEIIEYIQIYSVIYYIFYMDYENFLEKSLEFIQLFCFRQSINVKSTNASVWEKKQRLRLITAEIWFYYRYFQGVLSLKIKFVTPNKYVFAKN